MQGRSFKNGEVTQEISDPSRTYRLLGSDKYVSKLLLIEFHSLWQAFDVWKFFRVVMLESHLVHSGTLTETEGADLYILAGHEASYWATKRRKSQRWPQSTFMFKLTVGSMMNFTKAAVKVETNVKMREPLTTQYYTFALLVCAITQFVDFQMRLIKS